jgi:hypothetical protein
MNQTNPKPPPPDIDDALKRHVLARATAINGKLLGRLATIADDFDAGHYLAAIGGLDGIEREIDTMRSFLLLFR